MKLKVIIPFVIAAHAALAFFFAQKEPPKPFVATKKMLAVQTVKLSPTVTKGAAPASVKAVEPKKVTRKPKEKPKPKPVKIEPTPKPTPAPKKKEWVAAAKEKIGKITLVGDNGAAASITLPKLIHELETDLAFSESAEALSAKEMAYRDELAYRLRLYLKPPEYGDVKIKLTLGRLGKIVEMKILEFKSKRNSDYIETHLPQLEMPPFGANFSGHSTYDFTIIMSNQ